MAGAGQRFVDAGYSVPKPLIDIHGKPMIVRAAESLPPSQKWMFICRDEHIQQANIDIALKKYFDDPNIMGIDYQTEGQACTCLLAKDMLLNDDFLTIGACDNAMTYRPEAFGLALENQNVDAWIWTFRDNPAVLQNPKMYGWVKTDDEGNVKGVSCKVPISENPMRDHAVIGSFSFRRAKDFVACAEEMIRQNIRINNEFYVDVALDVAVKMGMNVKVFEVDQYICWGTPRDLELYHCWHRYFLGKGLD